MRRWRRRFGAARGATGAGDGEGSGDEVDATEAQRLGPKEEPGYRTFHVANPLQDLWRLATTFGWYKGEKLERAIDEQIERKTGLVNTTFRQARRGRKGRRRGGGIVVLVSWRSERRVDGARGGGIRTRARSRRRASDCGVQTGHHTRPRPPPPRRRGLPPIQPRPR